MQTDSHTLYGVHIVERSFSFVQVTMLITLAWFLFMKFSDKYGEFLDYLKYVKGLNEKTVNNYRFLVYGSLSHSIQDMNIESSNLIDVVKSVTEIAKTHGKNGPTSTTLVLKKYFEFLEESGIEIPFKWRSIKTPKPPKKEIEILEPDEIEEIREALLTSTSKGVRNRTIFELTLSSALRVGELVSLNREDWNSDSRELMVTNIKSKERQMVLVNKEASKWIDLYIGERKDEYESLFASEYSGRLHRASMIGILNKVKKELGMKKELTFTIIRKTIISEWADKAGNPKYTQNWARHRKLETTLNYYVHIEKNKAKMMYKELVDR